MRKNPASIKKTFLFIAIVIFLCLVGPLIAGEPLTVHSIFIPVFQSFDFEEGKIVDIDKGDVAILPEGIEVNQVQIEIAALDKGFIEDVKGLPDEELIGWTDFVDYTLDMLYAVKCLNNNYALFELVDIKASDNQLIGIEIRYKYQPDGSRDFF